MVIAELCCSACSKAAPQLLETARRRCYKSVAWETSSGGSIASRGTRPEGVASQRVGQVGRLRHGRIGAGLGGGARPLSTKELWRPL